MLAMGADADSCTNAMELSKEEMHRCLRKLSPGELSELAREAKAGRLNDSIHSANIAEIIAMAK